MVKRDVAHGAATHAHLIYSSYSTCLDAVSRIQIRSCYQVSMQLSMWTSFYYIRKTNPRQKAQYLGQSIGTEPSDLKQDQQRHDYNTIEIRVGPGMLIQTLDKARFLGN